MPLLSFVGNKLKKIFIRSVSGIGQFVAAFKSMKTRKGEEYVALVWEEDDFPDKIPGSNELCDKRHSKYTKIYAMTND